MKGFDLCLKIGKPYQAIPSTDPILITNLVGIPCYHVRSDRLLSIPCSVITSSSQMVSLGGISSFHPPQISQEQKVTMQCRAVAVCKDDPWGELCKKWTGQASCHLIISFEWLNGHVWSYMYIIVIVFIHMLFICSLTSWIDSCRDLVSLRSLHTRWWPDYFKHLR